ncbi:MULTISPECIES: hypothetical protein [unclassified Janthinobacterium]|uniref:hypothetical protein n=1 Tax=unclassified Janthinobacterium TaxID=2610881 RepID=UPI0025B05C2B|nr:MULTISPECIES: hypothetical protein [unclassified Janthinobacterium]MDN2717847.1 hypothetical protein [Janthinobacterium sp. SUN120]MDO8041262.1 hypothetical protein [Janthinobacterium sp. SUN137]
MHLNNKHQLNGYTFVISTALSVDGRYRGLIWISQRGDNGAVLDPALCIETPGALKSIQAIKIEALAYVQELMQSDALGPLLDAQMEDTAQNQSY